MARKFWKSHDRPGAASIRARVFTEFAWHSLFIRNLLIRPEAAELAGFTPEMVRIRKVVLDANARAKTASRARKANK